MKCNFLDLPAKLDTNTLFTISGSNQHLNSIFYKHKCKAHPVEQESKEIEQEPEEVEQESEEVEQNKQ